ncbi:MAG: cysteine rich repeat-containing protein [Spirochaetes bacterium]|jgi:phage host-nuclease inhibitor protein Gam|nr:cysteine rich repeat-containing protein [Spirochaetota bacterium]
MKKTLFFVLFSVAILFAVTAYTQEDVQKTGPCKADAEKFCKDIKPGHGRIMACLKSHEAELSQACKDHRDQVKENMQAFKKDCRDDAKKLCKNIRHGHGRVIACLKSNKDKLTEACKAHFDK